MIVKKRANLQTLTKFKLYFNAISKKYFIMKLKNFYILENVAS